MSWSFVIWTMGLLLVHEQMSVHFTSKSLTTQVYMIHRVDSIEIKRKIIKNHVYHTIQSYHYRVPNIHQEDLWYILLDPIGWYNRQDFWQNFLFYNCLEFSNSPYHICYNSPSKFNQSFTSMKNWRFTQAFWKWVTYNVSK